MPKPEDGIPGPPKIGKWTESTTWAESPSVKERRERIATAAMGGFAAMLGYTDEQQRVPHSARVLSYVMVEALRWADALIVELDKGEK
jgi:hypothetical protein